MSLSLRYTDLRTMPIVAKIITKCLGVLGFGLLVVALAACGGASQSTPSSTLNIDTETDAIAKHELAEMPPVVASTPALTATPVPVPMSSPAVTPTPAPAASPTSLPTATPSAVHIPDTNLDDVIRTELGKGPGVDLTMADLASINRLEATGRGIFDLRGIENCVNLIELYLSGNPISDISPLASLIRLRKLHIAGARVSDISPLTTLTEMRDLNLRRNYISDISALGLLTKLTDGLSLGVNQITDLSPLASLTSLTKLELNDNKISDISPLASLTSLAELNLAGCTPLRCERGGPHDDKKLGLHHISDILPLRPLVKLESLILQGNQITDISPLGALTDLTRLHLSYNQISDISSLEYLNNLNQLYLDNNHIDDISPLVKNTGMAADSATGGTVVGPRVALEYNALDLSEDSQNLKDFRELRDRNVLVTVEGIRLTPQR